MIYKVMQQLWIEFYAIMMVQFLLLGQEVMNLTLLIPIEVQVIISLMEQLGEYFRQIDWNLLDVDGLLCLQLVLEKN